MEKRTKVYRNGVDKKTSIKLTPLQVERMEKVLEQHGNNVSEVLRQALNHYLDRLEEGRKEPARTLFNYEDADDVPW